MIANLFSKCSTMFSSPLYVITSSQMAPRSTSIDQCHEHYPLSLSRSTSVADIKHADLRIQFPWEKHSLNAEAKSLKPQKGGSDQVMQNFKAISDNYDVRLHFSDATKLEYFKRGLWKLTLNWYEIDSVKSTSWCTLGQNYTVIFCGQRILEKKKTPKTLEFHSISTLCFWALMSW